MAASPAFGLVKGSGSGGKKVKHARHNPAIV